MRVGMSIQKGQSKRILGAYRSRPCLVGRRCTASSIAEAISNLPTDIAYNYVRLKTTTKILISEVVRPLGPIILGRYDPWRGRSCASASQAVISANMISRLANAIRPYQPVNIDYILGGSYNTRSALETLLAHTPEFYFCYPERIEFGASTGRPGRKHLMWCPDAPHVPAVIHEMDADKLISEIANAEAAYETLSVAPGPFQSPRVGTEAARCQAKIQIALILIGRQLGYRSWGNRNDKAIIYNERRLGEMEGVVEDLEQESLIAPHSGAIKAALLIDCIWFRNARFMPAVIEIEHTTGITSGLTRMKKLQDVLPPFPTRWVVAAPDEDREKLIEEANRDIFKPLRARFFPYSAVEELYSLCQRRSIGRDSINEPFLDAFMESAF